jgi:hypothetical protein
LFSHTGKGKVPNQRSQAIFNTFGTDMFGRLKTSEPYTIFDSQHRYKSSGDYSDAISGTASVTHNANQSTELLNVGTALEDKVTRESKRVFPYQPGKSLQVMQTFVFAPAKANLRQRAGHFSRQNGFYLELTGGDLFLVQRSYVTGSLVETRIPQSEWNVDTLDGAGSSDLVLDISKAQIMFFEYEWLGVGSVRIGFVINGYFIIAHQFDHANLIDSTYITTATLPIRYEIENLGTTASVSSMKQICATVISNGGYERRTEDWNIARSTSVAIPDSFFPVASIRLASGREDSVILPSAISILPTSAGNFEWAVIRNATITAGTWVAHTESSGNVEYNISATSMSGGAVVAGGFVSSTNQASAPIELDDQLYRWNLQLGRTNAEPPVSDTFTVALKALGNNQSAVGSISWNDLL